MLLKKILVCRKYILNLQRVETKNTKNMQKEDKLMMECYRELFEKSEPPADFDELVANATINEQGQKVIPFNDHEIDHDLLLEIIDKHSKKLRTKWKRQVFKSSILLGCSPKSK